MPVYTIDNDGDRSTELPLSVTINDDVQRMQDGSWAIVEPNTGESATTAVIDVTPGVSADGVTVTEVKFGDYPSLQLDQDVAGEQKNSILKKVLSMSR
ncbi:hypothetical protein QW180_20225 [Vibrio sinaloensis]|nr:hypothetical protein [Vibrio sinaloensis]